MRIAGIGAFDLVDLVLEDEPLAAEGPVQNVVRIIDFHGPALALGGPPAAPGMAVETRRQSP